jgi:putative ABC transport system permease protein
MFGNAFKISLRTLYREKRYAAINIAGLSLALACIIILALYLRSELTYDRHFDGYANLYRVVNEFNTNGTVDDFALTSQMLGPMMQQEVPDIEAVVRFRFNDGETVMHYGELGFYWENAMFATPNVFEVFSHDIIYGDPATALLEPATVAISESVARTYFGDRNPIGEIMTNDGGSPYRVTLVFADQPDNTHLKYPVLFSSMGPFTADPTNITQQQGMLFGVSWYNYVKMREGYDPAQWTATSQAFFDKHMKQIGEANGMSWRSWLQPLKDIHLYSDVGYDQPTGNVYYLYAFSAVAVFILIIACINYMNLSTARSAKRAREVGMRKILGSTRKALIVQFLSESLLYSVIALVLGIVIVEVAFTFTSINDLLNKPLTLSLTNEPALVLAAAGLALAVGLLSGLYPALYLSSWQPLNALVGNRTTGKSSAHFRSALVFIQFTISVAVIASTLLMGLQMRYINSKELGYEKENRVIIELRGLNVLQQIPVITAELLKNPEVVAVTTSNSMLGDTVGVNSIPVETMSGEMEATLVSNLLVGKEFVEVMGLNLLEGRSFNTRLLTDVGSNIVVNEALVRHMGWDNALGKRIMDGRVIGVLSDFHYASLRTPIAPFAMRTYPDNQFDNVQEELKAFINRNLIVNIKGGNVRETLASLEDQITRFDPKHPFTYTFFDESLNLLYQSEERLMKLIGIFAVICIFISCLGLYGLAAFTTEQRTREIGIRKVLGASAGQIIGLLSRNILGLVTAGAVLATVLSWLAIDEWLSNFSYRTSINPLAFVVATVAALVIAYATVALQSWKTAQSDPSLSLRHE